MDEWDPIKEWVDPNAYPFFPKHFIPCPLTHDELKQPFSLDVVGIPSFYRAQEKAMVEFYTSKPFTIPTSPTKKAKASMAALAPDTLDLRVRVMREFIGFTTKWLHLPATMEHVLNPQVVAKYIGFHVAKGNKESYMHSTSIHLSQVATFVNLEDCPKRLDPLDDATWRKVDGWYTNIKGFLASISTHYQAKEKGITLWSVWQAVLSMWASFLAKFKVSGVHLSGPYLSGSYVNVLCRLGCASPTIGTHPMVQPHLAPPPPPPPFPC